MATKRIEWVDAYKGILIVLVVLAHSLQEVYQAHHLDFISDWFRNIIYSFHMPAFMAMSGYLVYRVGGGGSCVSVIHKRFKQLIVPLLVWTIPLSYTKNVSYIDLILYPNNGYWFLWALFFIIVVYNLINWICIKFHLWQELCVAAIACIMVGVQMVLPNAKFLGYEYIAYYFIFYMMGFYANKYHQYLPKNLIVIIGLFVLWFTMACFWTPNELPPFLEQTYLPPKIMQLIYRMLTPVVFVLAMYSAAPKLEELNNPLWNKFKYIGKISLGIYLAHMVLKDYFGIWLNEYLPTYPIWIHIVIEFCALMILSIGIVRLLQRWDITNKWLLGKF